MSLLDDITGSSLFNLGTDILFWESQKDFARENRDFMARREDSSVQRRVQDLIKAGLNPMLAYGSSAASNASAAQPGGFQPSESMARGSVMKLNSAQAGKIEAEKELIKAQRDNVDVDTMIKASTAPKMAAEIDVLHGQFGKLMAEIREVSSREDLNKIEHDWKLLDLQQRARLAPHILKLLQLQLPKAENQAIGEEIYRWFKQNVSPLLPDLGSSANTLGTVAPFIK